MAIEDLNDIEDYIARDNPARAVSFVDELIDLGDSLSNEGEAEKGTPAKWIRDTNVRELYYKNYTIVYNFEAGNNKNTERPQFQAMMDVADLFGFSK